MARPIITESQANRDNLLQVLLFDKYKSEFIIRDNRYEHKECLTFDEWLEKILEEF